MGKTLKKVEMLSEWGKLRMERTIQTKKQKKPGSGKRKLNEASTKMKGWLAVTKTD